MAITAQDIRTYISDMPEANLLLDNREEFTDERIDLSMRLAVSSFNAMPPRSAFTIENFLDDSTLLYGTLAKMFEGQMALSARNHMSYSDGGVSLPIEEKYPMYVQLANQYNQLFMNEASRIKVEINMNGAWGEVSSDYGFFPVW